MKDCTNSDKIEIVCFYENILNSIYEIDKKCRKYYFKFQIKLKSLIKNDYFISKMNYILNNKLIDSDVILNDFICDLYKVKHAYDFKQYIKNNLQEKINSIYKHQKFLKKSLNKFLNFFMNSQQKYLADCSFQILKDYKSNIELKELLNMIYEINNIDSHNLDFFINDFKLNVELYRDFINQHYFKELNHLSNNQLFLQINNSYNSILEKDNYLKSKLEISANKIKGCIDNVKIEQTEQFLKSISVKELRNIVPENKINELYFNGYTTLYDIFKSNESQLCMINSHFYYKYAERIISYVEKLYKSSLNNCKIKISYDNKAKEVTKLVENIYIYINIEQYVKNMNEIQKIYQKNTVYALDILNNVSNGISYFLSTFEEKQIIENEFDYIKLNLENNYKKEIEHNFNDFKTAKINLDKSWEIFKENPTVFINILEKICPSALSNNDNAYGLQKNIAKEIDKISLNYSGLKCTLRKYQEFGVRYIINQKRVLLGDEMGLGKTIEAIAAMVVLANSGATHFLVICPASILENWQREIQKNSNLSSIIIHGFNKYLEATRWIKDGGVGIINYESTSIFNRFEQLNLDFLVVDEAHYIKNINAERTKNTLSISNLTDKLLFMTGTPIENNVYEMISLIKVLNPRIASKLNNEEIIPLANDFKYEISPVYYRRRREDVLNELPEKIEIEEWCRLNELEEEKYDDCILNRKYMEARRVSWNINDLKNSSKANLLKNIITQAQNENRKIIVFSFFLDTLQKLGKFLGNVYGPINGSVEISRRQAILDDFENAPNGSILLAEILTGGTGLNIQTASVVVICEPQFKPSTENQAISRCYRMGQARNVLVYRLLCENTIDEKLLGALKDKQSIFDEYADVSVAGKNDLEIDQKSFNKIMEDEYNRIKNKNN